MKSQMTLAASIFISLAAAVCASNAIAQNSAPNKVVTVPPPPGGPDKLTTHTQPTVPTKPTGAARLPVPVDEYAGTPGRPRSTCFPSDPNFGNCVSTLDSMCTSQGGGMSTNGDGSVTCKVG